MSAIIFEKFIAPKDVSDAIAMQKQLRLQVNLRNSLNNPQLIAGVDCSYDIKNNISYAVVVLMRMGEFKPLNIIRAQAPTTFPYIPGFLSFREIPVILKALQQLEQMPDLFMVDGQGVAHPRRFGIAAHLGVLTHIPAIGVAKSLLCGHYQEPLMTKGSCSDLIDKNEKIGTVLRSKDNIKPLFISPGHLIDHETAVEITLRCLLRHRLPEPTRIADKLSKQKDAFLLIDGE